MVRILPILLGLAVLLGAGVVHGVWTDRWRPSEELVQATQHVQSLPTDIGAWKSTPYEQEAEYLALAGATADYSRTFIDPETGEQVLVILLVGRASRMVVHRPEHCYEAAGYELEGAATPVEVKTDDQQISEFFSGLFTREEDGPSQLRIYWSFGTPEGWEASSNPRWKYARHKVLYKLYIVRSVTGANRPLADDPCIRLLKELLPILQRKL